MTHIPAVTRAQMIEIDRIMIDDAGISLLQMMENAGRALAEFVIDRYSPGRAAVVVGRGGNGGGGLVAARHLSNRGVPVDVVTSTPPREFAGVPAHQLTALSLTPARFVDELEPAPDVIIDAMIGYSLSGSPRGRIGRLIGIVNSIDCPVVSLDVPSGVDSTTGENSGVAVEATATLTLALPKTGLAQSSNTGDLYLADISVPAGVYHQVGIDVPDDLFSGSQIIAVESGPDI